MNATMAAAIRQLTVERGIDPREFSLVSFGGAGGQHAIPVAEELGIDSVIFAPQASTFSAMGMLTADLKIAQALTAFGPFDDDSLRRAREIVQLLGERAAADSNRTSRVRHRLSSSVCSTFVTWVNPTTFPSRSTHSTTM